MHMKRKYLALLVTNVLLLLFVSCGPSAEENAAAQQRQQRQQRDSLPPVTGVAYPSGGFNVLADDVVSSEGMELIEHQFFINDMEYRAYFTCDGGVHIVNTSLDSLQKALLECQIHMCKQ